MRRWPARRFAGLPAATGFIWCAGACLALFGGWQPGSVLLLSMAIVALAAAACGSLRMACLLGGFLLTSVVAQQQVERRWPAALDGQRVVVEGQIRGIPADDGAQRRFDFEGAIVVPSSLARPVRLRVTARVAGLAPRAGERWRLLVRLETPRATLNPGGVDAERLLFRERIDAQASVVPSRFDTRLATATPGLDRLREAIGRRIREAVVDRDAAALIAGLAVGSTATISREQWRVYGATGTVHLVAISGLHVTLFAWLATRAARFGWRRLQLGRCGDREPFAACCGLLAATGYALLAGFGVPARRTLLMLLVWWIARLAGRRAGGFEVIGCALLVVLLFDPLAPLDAGFWLSFAAIAVLIGSERQGAAPVRADGSVLLAGLRRIAAALLELIRTQWRVTVALAPATLALFGSVPLAGGVANLVAIPLYSFLLVPLILAALAVLPLSATLASAGWQLAGQVHRLSWPLFEAAAGLPGAIWQHEITTDWLLVALLALPLAALPGPWVLRATALAVVLPLLGPPLAPLERGAFRAWLLDTGDGMAVLVMTRRHTLLYDTGDVYGSEGGRAARTVLPALRAAGRGQLDLLVQSRSNPFRVAGVAALLEGLPVRELRSGGRWVAAPRPAVSCDAESGWFWDDVELRLFPAGEVVPADGDADPPSCVLRITAQGGRGAALLVPGQVDAGEARWLAAAGSVGRLQAEVVVAPRRGSVTAVTAGLVTAIGAREVLVASRELSVAGRARIARTWGLEPQKIRATAREGMLIISSLAGGLRVESWRDTQPARLWRVPRD